MEREKSGVPFKVHIRAYVFHSIIAVIALIVYLLLFVFLGAGVTTSCAELKRINDAPLEEIIFSNARCGEDALYYLKQHHVAGRKDTAVSCDIFMTINAVEYNNNDIYFRGTLEEGTCAVSENLAMEYGVKIGESVRFIGMDKTFKVARFLTAQSGIDKDYLREGIAVFAYDEEVLNFKPYSFVSFMVSDDDNQYPSLISLIYIVDWKSENVSTLVIAAITVVAAFTTVVIVLEYFLFRRRIKDYKIMAELGKRKGKTFLTVWLENVAKYIAPFIISALCFLPRFMCYGAMYAIPILLTACGYLAGITAYSLIITRRLYLCHPKIKL